MLQHKYWFGPTVNVWHVEGKLNVMFEEILLAASNAVGRSYKVKELWDWDYNLYPEPNATLTIIGPDGQEYDATIRLITGEGWTLDHISKWHKQESTTSKKTADVT
jgi:hypothetical protein